MKKIFLFTILFGYNFFYTDTGVSVKAFRAYVTTNTKNIVNSTISPILTSSGEAIAKSVFYALIGKLSEHIITNILSQHLKKFSIRL